MATKPFDYKKEYKELYQPKTIPQLVDVPEMDFIMVDGRGDPNDSPLFQEAVEILYGISYTIKMSSKKGMEPEGYFDYVVPPLEGLWWIDGTEFSFTDRENWLWTLMIRLPEFVTSDVFAWAKAETKKKKPELGVDKARFETFKEGLCVQIMHIGPYSTEPESMAKVKEFLEANGLVETFTEGGKHHEIYLSDPRKANPEKMKTVLRHPVRKV